MKQQQEQGKLVTFHRNGDAHFKGLTVSVSRRSFSSLQTLLAWLNEKVELANGARCLLRIPDGRRVLRLEELEAGGHYAVSSSQRLVRSVDYAAASRAPAWHHKRPSAKAGRMRRDDLRLIMESSEDLRHDPTQQQQQQRQRRQQRKQQQQSQAAPRPRTITVISNTHRACREKLLVSTDADRDLDSLLADLTSILVLAEPPVLSLYTAYPPYRRVTSVSQLLQKYKDYDSFLACGCEMSPTELRDSRQPQWSDASSSSALPADTASQTPTRRRDDERRPEPTPRAAAPWPTAAASNNGDSNLGVGVGVGERPRLSEAAAAAAAAPQRGLGVSIDSEQHSVAADAGRYEEAADSDRDYHNGPARSAVATVRIRGVLHTLPAPSGQSEAAKRHPPGCRPQLHWVYGCQCSAGLQPLPTGELAFCAGRFVLLLDTQRHRQRHYEEHTGEVTCLAVHPTQSCIASGQAGSRQAAAQVRVWNTEELTTLAVLTDKQLQGGVTSLSFSVESSGSFLLAADSGSVGQQQRLLVFDWSGRRLVLSCRCGRLATTRAAFHPDDDSVLVTIGSEHVSFWRIFHDSGGRSRALRDRKSGQFLGSPPESVSAMAFDLAGNVVTGDSLGRLQLWVRDQEDAFVMQSVERLSHAHSEAVVALHVLGDGAMLSASGRSIHVWDTLNGYSHIKELTLPNISDNIVDLALKHPRSLDGRLVIGTSSNSIHEGSLHEQFFCVAQGHCGPGVSVCSHPRQQEFVSCGPDSTVCCWAAASRRLIWSARVEDRVTCATFHPKGHLLALGTGQGRLIVLHYGKGEYAMSCQVSQHGCPIRCLQFNPSGRLLALGCDDGRIAMMATEDNGVVYRRQRDGFLRGHEEPVLRIDFSVDSATLRSEADGGDLRWWSVPSMSELSAESVANVRYSTESCCVSHCHAAAWNQLPAGDAAICASCLSAGAALLCVGDTCGRIVLFSYPPHPHQADTVSTEAACGALQSVTFTCQDSELLTVAESEATIAQWQLVND